MAVPKQGYVDMFCGEIQCVGWGEEVFIDNFFPKCDVRNSAVSRVEQTSLDEDFSGGIDFLCFLRIAIFSF